LRALRQAEGGTRVSNICREHGVSEATYYVWKRKYSGLGLSELRELRQLREENAKLKRLWPICRWTGTCCRRSSKKSCKASASARAGAVDPNRLCGEHASGGEADDDRSVDHDLPEPARSARRPADAAAPAGGEPGAVRLSTLTVMLRREGWIVNAKRIYRLYTEDGLAVRTRVRKKIAQRTRVPALRAARPNQRWSMDFVAAKLLDGRWFRVLTVVDQFTRECVWLLADSSLNGHKVALALSQAIVERAAPVSITVDNGTEFVSKAMDVWAYQHNVQLDFIRPGADRLRTATLNRSTVGCGMNA
jgi:putative transposase